MALIMTLSFSSVAFAAKSCKCNNVPVVFIRGFGASIYEYDENGEAHSIFPPDNTTMMKAVPSLALAVGCWAAKNYEGFGKFTTAAMNQLLSPVACDETGTPRKNTGIEPNKAPTNELHKNGKFGLTLNGDDDYYSFSQDWRLSPLDNAVKLKKFVEKVKSVTHHDKVIFAAHSQGGAILASYLYLYGHKDAKKIIFLTAAYKGLSILGTLYKKEYDIGTKGDALVAFVDSLMGREVAGQLLTVLLDSLKKTGVLDTILVSGQDMLEKEFERIFAESLSKCLGYMPGTWAYVPDKDYTKAKKAMFGNDPKYTTLVKKLDRYHYNVQRRLTNLIDSAIADDVPVIITSGYGMSTIPVTKGSENHSDMLIDTKFTSIGATVAPFGKTLGKSYKQAVKCGHNHISPDKIVDASTGAYPEYTWYFKMQQHSEFTNAYVEFLNWAVHYNGQPTVRTNKKYPQFIKIDSDEKAVSPTESEKESIIYKTYEFFVPICTTLYNLTVGTLKKILSGLNIQSR